MNLSKCIKILKKNRVWICLIIIALVCVNVVSCSVRNIKFMYHNMDFVMNSEKFRKYKSDLQYIAYRSYEIYKEHRAGYECIVLNSDSKEWYISYADENDVTRHKKTVLMTDKEIESYRNVHEALHEDHTGLHAIYVYNDAVTFDAGYTTLIYSLAGKRPKTTMRWVSSYENSDGESTKVVYFYGKEAESRRMQWYDSGWYQCG